MTTTAHTSVAERVLVLGGVRSGKSAVAERLVAGCSPVTYVATADPTDPELRARVSAHQARRPDGWRTVELAGGGCSPAQALAAAPAGGAVLVDGLGAWLAGRMDHAGLMAPAGAPAAAYDDEQEQRIAGIRDEVSRFWSAAATRSDGPIVVVTEEAGLGLVPPDVSSRRWLDLAGDVAQNLADEADRVLLVVAGRVVSLPAGGRTARAPVGSVSRTHGDVIAAPDELDFAVNVWSGGPPAAVAEAIAGAPRDRYPDDDPARVAIAARYRRPLAETLVTAGAADAFWLLARVLRVSCAAVVHPAFTEPEAALHAAGVPVMRAFRRADDGWRLDPASVPDDADLVVVGNPNNPTGTLDDPDRLAALCRPGRVTLVDEAFMDFVTDDAASLAACGDLPGLVVVRSVTKLWGLPGLRAGYLLGPAGVVRRCGHARQPWPVGADALAAIRACLDDRDWQAATAATVADNRIRFAAALGALPGVGVWPGAANFLLMRVADGPAVTAGLSARGMAVRPSTFPGLDPGHLRVAVRSRADNDAFVHALRATLADPDARS